MCNGGNAPKYKRWTRPGEKTIGTRLLEKAATSNPEGDIAKCENTGKASIYNVII